MLSQYSGISLLQSIDQFEDFEMSEERMVRLLRFHQCLQQQEGHFQWLLTSIRASFASSLEEKIVAAEYLAFLTPILCQAQRLELDVMKKTMIIQLNQHARSNEKARKMLGILLDEEQIQGIYPYLDGRIVTQNGYSDLYPLLDIVLNHIQWKFLLHQPPDTVNQSSFVKVFLQILIKFDSTQYGKSEEILPIIAKIAIALTVQVQHIKQQWYYVSQTTCRQKLITMRQAWFNLTFEKQEAALEICKAITVSFNLLGLQSEGGKNETYTKIFNFLQKNKHYINETEYLELLLTFLNNSEGLQQYSKEITLILHELLNSIKSGFYKSTRKSYRSKAMMIDIIIKISSLFTCESSRQITKLINPNKQKKKLERYYGADFNFRQLVENCQNIDQLTQDLLFLRITIEINQNAFIQLKRIYVLIYNLVKMILLGFLSDQCYEIIEKIIQRINFRTLQELKDIPMIQIIQDVKPILFNQVRDMDNPIQQFNTMYHNLLKVITLLSKYYTIEQLKKPRLFIRILQINRILNNYAVTPQLMKSQKQLLTFCIQHWFENQYTQQLFMVLNELISQLKQHKSIQTFLILLKVMDRSRPYPFLHFIYTFFDAGIQTVIKQIRIPPTVMQSYRILRFLLTKPGITSEVVLDAWKLIRNVERCYFIDQFEYVIQLQRYCDHYICNNENKKCQINHLLYQMKQISGLLDQIDNKKNIYLVRIEELTRLKLIILRYFLQVVTKYTESNGLSNQIITTIVSRQVFSQWWSIAQSQISKIRLIQCNCQFTILLLIAHLRQHKICFIDKSIHNVIKSLAHRHKQLEKIYPKEYKTEWKYYSEQLIHKIKELREAMQAQEERGMSE